MNSRLRPLEMLMGLVACLSFLIVAGRWIFVVIPLLLAILASWWVPARYSTTPRQQRILFTVVGAPFLALALFRFSEGGVVGFQRIAVLGAVYVLVGAVLELYRRADQARPAVFHAGVVTVMMVAGLTRANPYYLYCVMLYACGLIALLRSPASGMIGATDGAPRRTPKAILVVSLLVTGGLSMLFFDLWPRVTGQFHSAYVDSLVGSLNGETLLFGPSSDLSSIQKSAASDEIAARVFGPPVNLRGQVMWLFLKGRWSGVTARAERDILKPKRQRFRLAPEEPGAKSWRVVPLKPVAGPLPVPAGAFEVVATCDELEVDAYDGLVADNEGPYQIVARGLPGAGQSPRRPEPDSAEWVRFYLQVPEHVRQRLAGHAVRIAGEGDDPRTLASAIEIYLGENGQYKPEAEHPHVDPILHFLEDGKLAGHCEYFATSMALMLRARGVPTRYVIGYRAAERNPWGGYLIVRDRDAHAWVEVYYDGQWHVFDPTPAAEQQARHPDGYQTPSLAAIWDYVKSLTNDFWLWITDLNAQGVWGKLLLALGGALMLVGGGVAFRFRESLARFWRKPVSDDPLERLGRLAYGRLAKKGLIRGPAETPSELAQRAHGELGPEVGEWLESYGRLRFRGGSEEEAQRLEKELASWN